MTVSKIDSRILRELIIHKLVAYPNQTIILNEVKVKFPDNINYIEIEFLIDQKRNIWKAHNCWIKYYSNNNITNTTIYYTSEYFILEIK